MQKKDGMECMNKKRAAGLYQFKNNKNEGEVFFLKKVSCKETPQKKNMKLRQI